ncbi:hypothetical protein JFPO14_contig00002-0096 [Edwardsiella piscicida]|nr:plasmid partitioning protein RepB [Edwardsiella piscicida]GBK56773.1 hypothetical protein JFPO14_contig00002-0096 [Edwardsiella piscicida]
MAGKGAQQDKRARIGKPADQRQQQQYPNPIIHPALPQTVHTVHTVHSIADRRPDAIANALGQLPQLPRL